VKISFINGICLSNDAISNAVREEVAWLKEQHDVRLYVYACDDPALSAHIVNDVGDIAFDAHFQSSDLVIFHFGVFYPLFNLLAATPKHARRMVVFHNITPKEFVAPSSHHLIDQSFAQMANMDFADHVVCVSQTNLDVLRDAGIGTPATILPLPLRKRPMLPSSKPSFQDGVLRFAFLGRFVRSKGPSELLVALGDVLRKRPALRVQLDLVGSLTFSDEKIIEEMKALTLAIEKRFGSRVQVTLRANASEQEKNDCLARADIFVLPSYHEGFCVPILEALASGCRVVSYDNSNIPHISGGLATLVPSGDKEQLAAAMCATADACAAPAWRGGADDSYVQYSLRAAAYVAQFDPHSAKRRYLHLIRRLAPIPVRNR